MTQQTPAPPTGAPARAAPAVHTIAAATHGRYLVARADGPGPAPLLVGFHGYGEHAERLSVGARPDSRERAVDPRRRAGAPPALQRGRPPRRRKLDDPSGPGARHRRQRRLRAVGDRRGPGRVSDHGHPRLLRLLAGGRDGLPRRRAVRLRLPRHRRPRRRRAARAARRRRHRLAAHPHRTGAGPMRGIRRRSSMPTWPPSAAPAPRSSRWCSTAGTSGPTTSAPRRAASWPRWPEGRERSAARWESAP